VTIVAINGFGRIGRAFFRLAYGSDAFDVVAINDPFISPEMARYLLVHDSVYKRYPRDVAATEDGLSVDGTTIPLLREKSPAALPWSDKGVDLVLESTGVFKRVLLSVPPKGEGADAIPQIIYGVNHEEIDLEVHRVVSAASCTTNSLVPVAHVLEREIGIDRAFLTTVHGYTADQQLVDSAGSSLTRSRAAAINIIPTTTGAAKATGKVIPALAGKMDGMAFRVPVPTGSVTDFTVVVRQDAEVDAVNALFRRYAETTLVGVLGVSEDPLVSTDIIGDPRASIVDLSSTGVVDRRLLKVVTFYDNEWGYANQLVRVAGLL
jgi:glyceraldehyde 3-phosphate dehydrogenase